MKPFLDFRKKAIVRCGGKRYGSGSESHVRFLNKLQQAYTIYSRLLAARNPAVVIKSELPELSPAAAGMTLDMAKFLRDTKFQATMQEVVGDAIFLAGFTKTGTTASGKTFKHEGEEISGSETYTGRISPDQMVVDMSATVWPRMQYAGDYVDHDKETIDRDTRYDSEGLQELKNTGGTDNNLSEEASAASRPASINDTALFPRVRILELFIPKDRVILHLGANNGPLVRIQEWEGPETGPIDMLYFTPLPDNLMPLAPAVNWFDADDAFAGLIRKLTRQAQRQKSILVGQRGEKGDVATVTNANDGEAALLDNPNGASVVSYGGIAVENYTYAIWLGQQLDLQMGNIALLGGLGAQTDTVGQEQMLQNSNNIMLDDMRSAVTNHARVVIEKCAWYNWRDPLRVTRVLHELAGMGISIPQTMGPWNQLGQYTDYTFDVQPYSMLPQTPRQEAMEIKGIVLEIVAPLLAYMQSQGQGLNTDYLMSLFADKLAVSELGHLITEIGNMPTEASDTHPGKPNTSRREYLRTSVSGTTQRGADASLAASMMSGGGGNTGAPQTPNGGSN